MNYAYLRTTAWLKMMRKLPGRPSEAGPGGRLERYARLCRYLDVRAKRPSGWTGR